MTVHESSRRDDQVVVLHDRGGPEPPYRVPGLPPILSQTRRSGVWRTELYRLAGIPAATRRWLEPELADLVARVWAGTEWLAAHGRLAGPVTAEALRWSQGHGPFFDFLLVEGPPPPPHLRLQQIAAAALAVAPDLPADSPLRRLLAAAPQRVRGEGDIGAFLADLEGLRPVATGQPWVWGSQQPGGLGSSQPPGADSQPPGARRGTQSPRTPGGPGVSAPTGRASAPAGQDGPRVASSGNRTGPATAPRTRTAPGDGHTQAPLAPRAAATPRRTRPSRRQGLQPLWRLVAVAAVAGAVAAVIGIAIHWALRPQTTPGAAPAPGAPGEPRPRPGDPRRRLDAPAAAPAPSPGTPEAPQGAQPVPPGTPPLPPGVTEPGPAPIPDGQAQVPPAPPTAPAPPPPSEPKGLPIVLAIEGPAQVQVGQAAEYRLRATDATGRPVEVNPVWVVVSGTERAWIDTGGFLHARAPGAVTLRGVAVGHNLSVDRTIQVVP